MPGMTERDLRGQWGHPTYANVEEFRAQFPIGTRIQATASLHNRFIEGECGTIINGITRNGFWTYLLVRWDAPLVDEITPPNSQRWADSTQPFPWFTRPTISQGAFVLDPLGEMPDLSPVIGYVDVLARYRADPVNRLYAVSSRAVSNMWLDTNMLPEYRRIKITNEGMSAEAIERQRNLEELRNTYGPQYLPIYYKIQELYRRQNFIRKRPK